MRLSRCRGFASEETFLHLVPNAFVIDFRKFQAAPAPYTANPTPLTPPLDPKTPKPEILNPFYFEAVGQEMPSFLKPQKKKEAFIKPESLKRPF